MENLMSLEEFREVLTYHPWHFWSIVSAAKHGLAVNSSCNDIVTEFSYQNSEAAGRNEIRNAIVSAEQKFFAYSGFYPMPRYTSAIVDFPKFLQPGIERIGYSNADGRWIAVQLPEGFIEALGVEARMLINGAVVPVYSDSDGDSLNDTFTLTVPTTVTNPAMIEVYFNAADRMNNPVSDRYRIRPLDITISAGTATIKGKRWLCVPPKLYNGFRERYDLEEGDNANFATSLEVYSHYCNTAGTTEADAMVKLIWESPPYPHCCTVAEPAAEGYAIARGIIRNSRLGLVGIGESIYNTTTGAWHSYPWASSFDECRPPDRLEIRYRAGYPLETGGQRINAVMKATMARFAMAELNKKICACQDANQELHRWQYDMAMSSGNASEAYAYIAPEDLKNCPFGTRRGHIEAFRQVKDKRVESGFAL